jgi:hypothetical protein
MTFRSCAEYYEPDPPTKDYEPEYSSPCDLSWLSNYNLPQRAERRHAQSLERAESAALSPMVLLSGPAERKEVGVPAASPTLGLIKGGKSSDAAQRLAAGRCEGISVVVECAGLLEHACTLFNRDADKEGILKVEPYLRRVARAVNRLTREAARERRRQFSPRRATSNLFEV